MATALVKVGSDVILVRYFSFAPYDKGTFTSANVIGETSNATFTVSTSDDTATMNTAFESIDDNARIEASADGILDFSGTNPFGEA